MDIFPTAYAAPVAYYAQLLNSSDAAIEWHEYFPKQTIRNHCLILTSHGPMKLSIPLSNRKNKSITKDIQLSYAENWQQHHWRSIVTAYNKSPFFEFYADKIEKMYLSKVDYLIDFNQAYCELILQLLKTHVALSPTTSYLKDGYSKDFRESDFSSQDTLPYYQTFGDGEFVRGLSILDLLFNEGNRAKEYVKLK